MVMHTCTYLIRRLSITLVENLVRVSKKFLWADPSDTARLGQPVAKVEQAPSTSPLYKNKFNIHCPPMEDLLDIKLIRTDTTPETKKEKM